MEITGQFNVKFWHEKVSRTIENIEYDIPNQYKSSKGPPLNYHQREAAIKIAN